MAGLGLAAARLLLQDAGAPPPEEGDDATAELARGGALFFQWMDILTALGALAWYIRCWNRN